MKLTTTVVAFLVSTVFLFAGVAPDSAEGNIDAPQKQENRSSLTVSAESADNSSADEEEEKDDVTAAEETEEREKADVTAAEEDEKQQGQHEDETVDDGSDIPSDPNQEIADSKEGTKIHCLTRYMEHGVDEELPEHFFHGDVVSEKVYISYSGIFAAVEHLTSIDGGGFSDSGDRTTVSFGLRRRFGMVSSSLMHRWIHVHQEGWNHYQRSRHRTSIRSGVNIGPVQPYLMLASDLPAYTPANEGAVYGGVGVNVYLPLKPIRTLFSVKGSLMSTLIHDNQRSKTLYRASIGFTTNLQNWLYINPEVSILKDAFSEACVTWVGVNLWRTN